MTRNTIPPRFLSIVFFTLTCCKFAGAQSLDPVVETLSADDKSQVTFLNPDYLVFVPAQVKPDQKIPLVVYLHGAGGVGDNATKNTSRARVFIKGIRRFDKGPALVVAPQCRRTSTKTNERGGWLPEDLEVFLKQLKARHAEIDVDRVYLTGNSMGGYGCWVWGGHHPEHFAAIAPIVGGIGRNGPKDVTPELEKWAANLAQVPVYAFAGGKDRVVPAERSQRMVAAIRKAGGKRAKIKVYPEQGHGASKVVYSSVEFFDWMFSHKRQRDAQSETPAEK
ncbi:MAG: prolyl oligopeptidase family serine peptidase [Pirellulaceae bacterium]|jgi:predicted peptidase|nr:prolyl oligopeptidase family serine peptidase [Pirellulaceae bacterium]MDP7016857.1 prolyl oligopeptidase family serine peptidase [Pirellulaceae bacterium]